MKTGISLHATVSVFLLSGCSQTQPCEDIVEVNRQLHVCETLARTMNDNRYPQQAITARKRYQAECEDFRFIVTITTLFVRGQTLPLEKMTRKRQVKNSLFTARANVSDVDGYSLLNFS